MKVGVLALQGAVAEHIRMLKRCKVQPVEVRSPKDMESLSGLIIPGGESTSIGKLIRRSGLDKEILKKYSKGMPIYGTCAGAILLAKHIEGNKQFSFKLMDISIKRNFYGRQIDSFETELDIKDIGKFKGIFIRAPSIDKIFGEVKILAKLKNKAVMVRQGNLLVTTFHPELTDDLRIHKYFIGMIKEK